MSGKTSKKRVLLIDLAKFYGGANVRVELLARSFREDNHFAVATLAGSMLQQRLAGAGPRIFPVPFTRGDPRILVYLYNLIRRGRYNVIDAHNPQSQFWGGIAAQWAGIERKIITVHSTYGPEHDGSLKGRCYEYVLHLSSLLGSHFIAVSENVQEYLQGLGIPSKRITLIHNGIDLDDNSRFRRDSSYFKLLGWCADVKIVTVVARLEAVKGHGFLFEALKRLIAERPYLRCLIVGDGRMRMTYEEQVAKAKLGNIVHFTGFRNDISELLAGSDIFCLPSLTEGMPYAVLEATNHRLPLLLSNVGGMAELFEHGTTAFLVPPSDVDSLATGLGWLLDHPAESAAMGRAAFRFIAQRFGTAMLIEKTKDIYYNSNSQLSL